MELRSEEVGVMVVVHMVDEWRVGGGEVRGSGCDGGDSCGAVMGGRWVAIIYEEVGV